MATAHDRKILNRILNPLMPDEDPTEEKVAEDEQIDHPEYAKSRQLEKEAIALAEGGNIAKALEKFDEAIQVCPVNPSAFNNRAQAHRLNSETEKAMSDLDMALELSEGKGKSGCQAFVQRALIRRLNGDDQGAKADYEKAAALGSSFAKMQLVALNPYAAMYNKMLSEVMQNLREGKE
ncbi:unnamed protein product, partial [Mesorhabditis belari]|uniref:Tetratricopeptide repeat protein 36 n=1 Tax=Mesorhabditis belari TaxID=2138241 RepID=A0AAF3EWC1_9BILA